MIAVLDEGGLQTDAFANEFAILGDLVESLRDAGMALQKRSDVWAAEIHGGLALYNILFEVGHLDEDVRTQLWLLIDGIKAWDDGVETRTSLEFVRDEILIGKAFACVVLPRHDSEIDLGGKILHRIGRLARSTLFYRDAAELADFSEAEFIKNGARAFPRLYFHSDLEGQIARFSGHFDAGLRLELTAALGALNDYLPELLEQYPDHGQMLKAFNACSGFAISPESPSTHKNKKAMAERDVLFGETKISCEWHLKLQPHRDRIHFFFGKQSVSEKPVLIGIFCEHLST